jgi:SPP1 family predicted phage head-tail adaptor
MIGDYRHLVTFQDPGDPVPDGVGGYTQTWADLTPPTWRVQVAPAAAHDLERISAGGSVTTTATHVVRGRYHPGVSTKTRMLFNGKTYSITGARTEDERGVLMELTAVEQGTP